MLDRVKKRKAKRGLNVRFETVIPLYHNAVRKQGYREISDASANQKSGRISKTSAYVMQHGKGC